MSPHSNASKLDIKDDAGAKWNDAWTGKEIEGGRAIVADAPLERIPLFLKNGRTLPIVA